MQPLLSDVFFLPFWSVIGLAFGPELALVARTGRGGAAASRQDRGSIRLLVVGLIASVIFAVACAKTISGATFGTGREVAFWGGLAVIGLGALVRQHCFRMLGRRFTAAVAVEHDQPIIEAGAYRWVRHPSYLGCLLLYVGLGLSLTNWVSLALLGLASFLLFSHRIRVEEEALVQTLGSPYVSYMQRTSRIIPFVY